MIQTETMTVGTRRLVRTYSDAGYYIERDGVRYEEAVDPADSGRTYTETEEPIPVINTLEGRVEALEAATGGLTGALEKGLML